MNKLIILLVLIAIFALIIFYYMSKPPANSRAIYVKSDLDNKEYLVQDLDGEDDAARMLSVIYKRIFLLREYLLRNIDKYPQFKPYISQFCDRISKVVLKENSPNGKFTSYTVNKGDVIAICLRSRITRELHDINLIMYVVLHELSHVACPEIDHTDLFKKIFVFYLQIASMLDIYNHVDYQINPKEYCGITIRENLLK